MARTRPQTTVRFRWTPLGSRLDHPSFALPVPSVEKPESRPTLERDPQLVAREHFQRLLHPEAGEAWYDAPPVKLSRTAGELLAPAPCLGQHSERVFKEILGLTDEEYREYEDANVFF